MSNRRHRCAQRRVQMRRSARRRSPSSRRCPAGRRVDRNAFARRLPRDGLGRTVDARRKASLARVPTNFSAPRVRTAIVPSESRIDSRPLFRQLWGNDARERVDVDDRRQRRTSGCLPSSPGRESERYSGPPRWRRRTMPTVGCRVSSRSAQALRLGDRQERRAPGNRVLTSCWPSSDQSTIVYQPGCVDCTRALRHGTLRDRRCRVSARWPARWRCSSRPRTRGRAMTASTRAESTSRRSATARLLAKARHTRYTRRAPCRATSRRGPESGGRPGGDARRQCSDRSFPCQSATVRMAGRQLRRGPIELKGCADGEASERSETSHRLASGSAELRGGASGGPRASE